MSLLQILTKSPKFRSLVFLIFVALSASAVFADTNPMSALAHIYRADTYIVQRNSNSAHMEIYAAIDDLRFIRDRRAKNAIVYLNEANLNVGFDDVKARDFLNNGEVIVEGMIH